MTTELIAAVLVAALMHAGWNTIAKANAARAGDAVIVGILAGAPAAIAAPWTGIPAQAAWPQLVATALLHLAYFQVLAGAYRGGDLSVAYPLMRGLPPLLVAAIAVMLFDELLSAGGWAAILVLVAGVMLLGWEGLRKGALRGASARFVGLQIAIIASYTLVDASGVRAAGNPWSYIVWMFVLTALVLLPGSLGSLLALAREGPRAAALAALGGLFTFASYATAMWAMSRAPVALVAALRESSILFGAGFGAWFLGERFGARRWLAVGLVLGGVATMRLA